MATAASHLVAASYETIHAAGAPTAGPPPFHVVAVSPAIAYGFATDKIFAGGSNRWQFR